MFQVIDDAELARLQNENPTPSLGVIYQLRSTGEIYVWGPDSSTLDPPGAVSGAGIDALSESPLASDIGRAIAIGAGAVTSEQAPAQVIATPSGAVSSAQAAPFCGWGARYTWPTESFDAIVIPAIAQTAATTAERWGYLVVTVRAGSSAGTALATGTHYIPAYKSSLSAATVRLSAAVVPTDDAEGYFVSVEAYSALAVRVPCGYCQSTIAQSNLIVGSGVYKATSSPSSWGIPSSPNGYRITALPATTLRAPAAISAPIVPVVCLPPVWAVVGRECNVYFDGLIRGRYTALDWDVACAIGSQYSNRWTVVPGAAGTQTLTVSALHPSTADVASSVSATVTVAAASAAFTAQLLVIGDSLVSAGVVTSELIVLDTADATTSLTLLGTQGSGANLHEGYSGWSATAATSSGSPFWISGEVNMSSYITTNGYTGITHCVVALGINDVFSSATDAALLTAVNNYMLGVAKIIGGLQAYSGSIKIGVALPPPPAWAQDAFGSDYAAGQTRARYRRNWHYLVRAIVSSVQAAAATNVYLLPYCCSIDTENNFPTTTSAANSRQSATVTRQSNAVHPDGPGYRQLADAVWAWLKCNP